MVIKKMSNKTCVVIPIFLLLSLSPAISTAGASASDFCLLQGRSRVCPNGFQEEVIRLSVLQSFQPSQTNADGNALLRLGQIGASSLVAREYDNLYSLQLRACCAGWDFWTGPTTAVVVAASEEEEEKRDQRKKTAPTSRELPLNPNPIRNWIGTIIHT